MALCSKLKVALPSTGIIIRSGTSHRYVYKVTKAYRNHKGQPTNNRVSIGKLDEESGMLIPNDKYWEIYDNPKIDVLPSFESVRSIGATFLVGKILETIGVIPMLNKSFGTLRAKQILTTSAYMVCKGNVLEHILDWCENSTIGEVAVTDKQASALFSSITHDERMSFFRQWVGLRIEDNYLAYDVTSMSSYSDGIKETEWGYNRDGDKLPQINLGCYLGYKSSLPLFYVTYPGSIVDKSHMSYMMSYNEELGIKGITFVMDKGFCSTANVGYMHSNKLPYIMGVDSGHKATKEAINTVRDTIASMRKHINGGVYADIVSDYFYGELTNMHIYCDPALAENHRSDLYRLVESQEETLKQLNKLTKNESKRYKSFFDIVIAKDGTFNYERSYERIDNAAKNAGYFCLLVSDSLTSAEALALYRRKDMVEKGFDDLKNHIEMKRIRTHNSLTTNGKLFCAFIALIVSSYVNVKIKEITLNKNMSKNTLVSELEKIKVVFASNGSRLMNPLSKTQRLILEAFGLNEEAIRNYVSGN